MMQMLRRALTVFLVLLTPLLLRADDSPAIAIPGLEGPHSLAGGFFETQVDAGQAFSSITSVRFHIEGSAQSGQAEMPEGSLNFVKVPVAFSVMLADSFTNSTLPNNPVARFGPFELAFTGDQKFSGTIKGADWTFLKDGHATLRFSWETNCLATCRYVKYPLVDISGASIVIDGESVD